MKFSFAIVALLGLTSAIKIREDPKAADAKKADEAAATAAATPEKKSDPANPGKAIVDEATKSDDQKVDEDAAKAGKPVDTSNAPVAVEAPKKDAKDEKKEDKPVPLSPAEMMRNHILRIAATGQESVNINNVGVKAVADKYDKMEKKEVAEDKKDDTPAEREAKGKALGEA